MFPQAVEPRECRAGVPCRRRRREGGAGLALRGTLAPHPATLAALKVGSQGLAPPPCQPFSSIVVRRRRRESLIQASSAVLAPLASDGPCARGLPHPRAAAHKFVPRAAAPVEPLFSAPAAAPEQQ